jgi:hypothetical protein
MAAHRFPVPEVAGSSPADIVFCSIAVLNKELSAALLFCGCPGSRKSSPYANAQ